MVHPSKTKEEEEVDSSLFQIERIKKNVKRKNKQTRVQKEKVLLLM